MRSSIIVNKEDFFFFFLKRKRPDLRLIGKRCGSASSVVQNILYFCQQNDTAIVAQSAVAFDSVTAKIT